MFTQYSCLPRYCFVMFSVCCLALTGCVWFWSPITHTRLTIRVIDIDWVFYVLCYSLVPSLLCCVVWGWAGLIADYLKLLTREAIFGTFSKHTNILMLVQDAHTSKLTQSSIHNLKLHAIMSVSSRGTQHHDAHFVVCPGHLGHGTKDTRRSLPELQM